MGVRDEDIYRNDGPSVYLFRARTNALGLNDFNRHGREVDERETLCRLCGEEVEDLGHFMLRCKELNERVDVLVDRMRGENDRETLGALLFEGGELKEVGSMIYRLWGERSSKMGVIEGGRDSA